MNPLISVLIVNYNSSQFVANTINCLDRITKNPYQIFILDNNSKEKDYTNLKRVTSYFKNIFLERTLTNLTGSQAHGTALNHLVKKVATPYFSILDADATWLRKNWDDILINKLNHKVKIIGTQADGPIKPQDFPLIYACLIETKTFKNLKIDLCPSNLLKHEDTGFDMRQKYLQAGYKGTVLKIENTRFFKNGPFRRLTGIGEYYLNKELFASHFGRGSSLGSAKYRKSWKKYLYKIPKIGNWLIKQKGEKEKKQWILICKNIIDKQIKND